MLAPPWPIFERGAYALALRGSTLCSCPLELVLIVTEGGADLEPCFEERSGQRVHRSAYATLLQRDLGDPLASLLGAAQVLIDGGIAVNALDEGMHAGVVPCCTQGSIAQLLFRVVKEQIRIPVYACLVQTPAIQ